jgi:hypothetical protein
LVWNNLCRIVNKLTNRDAEVGSECVQWFDEKTQRVVNLGHALMVRGVVGTYRGETRSGHALRFKINGGSALVKSRKVCEQLFGRYPVYKAGDRWEMNVSKAGGARFVLHEKYRLRLTMSKWVSRDGKSGITFFVGSHERVVARAPGRFIPF